MIFSSLVFPIIIWTVGFYILYFVISAVVKNGNNHSILGDSFNNKDESTPKKSHSLIVIWIMIDKGLLSLWNVLHARRVMYE